MKYNQTDVAFSFHDLNVNKEDGVISKVLLAEVGKVKGHGVYADEEFTESIVNFGNKFGKGMKARFGHPNMSSTTLGTFIGRWKNFSFEDGNAYADLHLDDITRKKQVEGGGISMFDYITEMASNNPDMFGNSIVFRPTESEVKRSEVDLKDVDEDYDRIIEYKENKVVVDRYYARIKSLIASDLVDSPAATNSFFESFNTDKDFAHHATTFLDENPEIYKLLDANPEVFKGFMEKYEDYKTKQKEMSEEKTEFSTEELTSFGKLAAKVSTFLSGKETSKVEKKPDAEGKVSEKETELSAKIEVLTSEVAEKAEATMALQTKFDTQEIALSDLQTKFDENEVKLGKLEVGGAGKKADVDPNIDETKLSETDKAYNETAEAMKTK